MPIPDPQTLQGRRVVLIHRYDKVKMANSEQEMPAFFNGLVLRVDPGGLLMGDGTSILFYSYAEIASLRMA